MTRISSLSFLDVRERKNAKKSLVEKGMGGRQRPVRGGHGGRIHQEITKNQTIRDRNFLSGFGNFLSGYGKADTPFHRLSPKSTDYGNNASTNSRTSSGSNTPTESILSKNSPSARRSVTSISAKRTHDPRCTSPSKSRNTCSTRRFAGHSTVDARRVVARARSRRPPLPERVDTGELPVQCGVCYH